MKNNMYDLADNELNTSYVVESIQKQLKEKYKLDFKVVKIGERYGTDISDIATAICTVEKNNQFIFKVTYNMVEEKIVEDDFFLRGTCFYIEKEINRIFKDRLSIARVEIARKNKLDKLYKIDDFMKQYPEEKFIITLIIEKEDNFDYKKALSKISEIYNNININMIIYEMTKEEFEKFYEKNKNSYSLSMSYIESFNIYKRQIIRIEK